jgi:rod shape-determining protein MreC
MFKRPYQLAFGLVLLVVLVVFNLSEPKAARLKLAFEALYLPLFGLAGSAQDATSQLGRTLVPRRALQKQLETLQQENRQLQFQVSQLQAAAQENDRLRDAVQWQRRTPWQLRVGRVVGQDPANWWRSLHIDIGTRDGVATNCPVLTPEGLVGRVSEVGYSRSRVLLLGDPGCRVAAQVQEGRERPVVAKGVVAASASTLDRMLVEFSYLPLASPLRPGFLVLTSGDGGVFPKGIAIGQVADYQTNEAGLYLEARVRMAVNLNRLEEVWVLLP